MSEISGVAVCRKTRVAVVIGTLEVGGAELDILRNFPRLNRDEFEVVVVTFGPPGPLAPQLEAAGIPVVSRETTDRDHGRSTRRRGPLSEMLAPARRCVRVLRVRALRRSRLARARARQDLRAARRRLHDLKERSQGDRFEDRVARMVVIPTLTLMSLALNGAAVLVWQMIAIPWRVAGLYWWLVVRLREVRVIAWLRRRIGTVRYMWAVCHWMGSLFARREIDIAHFFLPHSYGYGMFAVRLWSRRTRTVMSRLSLNFYADDHRMLAWLERHVLHGRLDVGIGNSRLILDELVEEGVPRERVRLLYNGIEPEPFTRTSGARARARQSLSLPQDAFVVVAVGNLHAYKGHEDLIRAAAIVERDLDREWCLVIAGRDERGNRAIYEELIAELGLSERVTLFGSCSNVPELLMAADLFVQPSHHEGLPNAIIEAMAASLPVVGTTVGGIPEVVTATDAGAGPEEETGWLIPPRDTVALAEALLEASADSERRERMGARARGRVVREFSLERSVSTYEGIYRELVRRPGHAGAPYPTTEYSG